jgi:hypothetical protein
MARFLDAENSLELLPLLTIWKHIVKPRLITSGIVKV